MRYIGIDVAKATLAVYILSLGEFFTAENNAEGFKKILKKLELGDMIGVESTGSHHHKLALFFLKKGFVIKEINPIVTRQFLKASVRKQKTDKKDAILISELLSYGKGHEMTEENITNTLKKLFRSKKKLTQLRTAVKVRLTSLETSVGDPQGMKVIRNAHKAIIKKITTEIEKIDKEMLKQESEDITILESIPGISASFARGILAEIGDIQRFPNKRKLVTFAGLEPNLSESGSSVHSSGKLTKRGSPFLRYILYHAAFANIQRNTSFSQIIKKRNLKESISLNVWWQLLGKYWKSCMPFCKRGKCFPKKKVFSEKFLDSFF